MSLPSSHQQPALPPYCKVIGFGNDANPILDAIKGLYSEVAVYNEAEAVSATPLDSDCMAIVIVTGNDDKAAQCAQRYYQAGILTLVVALNYHSVPQDCCDSQTTAPIHDIYEATKIILDLSFNECPYISTDFNNLHSLLHNSRHFRACSFIGHGEGRLAKALIEVDNVLSPYLATQHELMLSFNIYFNNDDDQVLTMHEFSVLSDYVKELPDSDDYYWGLNHDASIAYGSIKLALVLVEKKSVPECD